MQIAVCDVGLGNLRSVERALLHAAGGETSVAVSVTSDPDRIGHCDKLVMPGQGGFGDCARALTGGIGEAVLGHIRSGKPYLGICLGLQVLFGESEEAAGCAGLALLPGRVVKLRGGHDGVTGAPLKIPHMGWNVAEPASGNPSSLLRGPEHFYFVHSYVVAPSDPRVVAATTEYGERFVSAVAFDNVFACQFHPEKSQASGLALLQRFLRT